MDLARLNDVSTFKLALHSNCDTDQDTSKVAHSPVRRWFALEGSGAKKERRGSKFTEKLLYEN